jgi:hypothetical protein
VPDVQAEGGAGVRIANWADFQGYKRRGPQWIKLHLSLTDQPGYLTLPLVARAVLPVLWITAARTSVAGELPDDPTMLARLCHLPVTEINQALNPLESAGFIERDKSVADLAPSVSGEKRREEQSRDRAEESSGTPPAAGNWSREACDDWITRFGGTAPGGRIGKALKPLVEKHGWPEVREAWRSYLGQVEAEFASAQRFAATYGRWADGREDAKSERMQLLEAGVRGGLSGD